MEIEQFLADLEAIEQNTTLLCPAALGARLEALEDLMFMYEALRVGGQGWAPLRSRVAALRARLEAINSALFAQIRDWLLAERRTPHEIRELLQRYSSYGAPHTERFHLDYEPVDYLVDGVLGLDTFQGGLRLRTPTSFISRIPLCVCSLILWTMSPGKGAIAFVISALGWGGRPLWCIG